ncbi:MAG: hypothetical protein ACI9S8_002793 [Chlamydiales bacterium]|jgi:hypothetical protein
MITIKDVSDYLMMSSIEKELLTTTIVTYSSEELTDQAYRTWDSVAQYFNKSSRQETEDVLTNKICTISTATGRERHIAKCIINFLVAAKIMTSKNPDRSPIPPQEWYSNKYDQVQIYDFFEDKV